MDKAVVTLVGMDSVGIIAKMCTYFAENDVNIIDIAQTTVRGIINMVMIVDLGTGSKGFDNVKNDMDNMSKNVKCVINIVKYDDLEALAEE
ncbi:MAG: ACT domain-containing protein [Candidatus Methanomethylophilaceae archaeon]|nr:ACT domain-containing protein [Candidatus Methanomethylophilaceae archaeon]